ncbi:MAG: hypothetical protein IPO88_20625 [Nannocystis sp.]|nr:hypothetical protein [Nannocystis sp.]
MLRRYHAARGLPESTNRRPARGLASRGNTRHGARDGAPRSSGPRDRRHADTARTAGEPAAASAVVGADAVRARWQYLLLRVLRSRGRDHDPVHGVREQIQADNVVSVTGAGDAIRGQLKAELRYPPDARRPQLV